MLNNQDLMARGLEKLNEIDGEQGDKVMQALADISPNTSSVSHSARFTNARSLICGSVSWLRWRLWRRRAAVKTSCAAYPRFAERGADAR